MYQIKCDGYLLHDDNLTDYRLHDMKLTLELNQFDSFEFTIYPNHPYYDKLKKLKSIITIHRDNDLIFRGRYLDDGKQFHNQLTIICEGDLAFLLDSVIRPYEFEGTEIDFFEALINEHNEQIANNPEKKFVIGQITALSSNIQVSKINTNYLTIWASINELIKEKGGYLTVDLDEQGNRRINYITENEFRLSNQEINFGENLLDLKVDSKGADIVTAVIPIGGKIEGIEPEKRLDITSLDDGIVMETEDDVIEKKRDYVFSHAAVERYGWIFKPVTFDDVDSDINYLQSVAIAELNEAKKNTESIELNAIDIAKLKLNINSFNVATMVRVTSVKHNYDKALFPITKMTLNLLNPTSNKLSLQKQYSTFTEKSISNAKAQQTDQASKIIMVEANVSGLEQKTNANETMIAETSEQLTSLINQTSEEILTQISESHYLKDEVNALVSNTETQIRQTSDEVEIRFNTFNQNIQDLQKGNDAQFQEISKYIRFKDGNILLGEEGNELTLNIQNDRISFLESGSEVAYFSNRKLYVLDGEFINSLKLGNFAFIPRSNGNVSFKKVN